MGQASDRRKREQRKRAASNRRAERDQERRRRVKGLLSRLQLLAAFDDLPADIRQQFFDCCGPDPVLAFDDSFPSADAFGGAYADVHAEVRAGFKDAAIELTGFDLPVRDFLAVAIPLSAMVRRTLASINSPLKDRARLPAAVRTFLEKADGPLAYLCRKEVEQQMWEALHQAVVVPLVGRSRLDNKLLHVKPAMSKMPGGNRLVMTLYAEPSPVKYIRLQSAESGGSRPMHRVGTSNSWNGVEWASWSGASLDGNWSMQLGIGADDDWPVYVQSHALKQLRARLDVYAYADWVEHWLNQSLRTPKIVSQVSGNDLLVAFEVMEQRLGYLVVTARDSCVAVRTFLFLTMAQTPEGRMLEKRLKLTRDEISYLRLHELSRFTQTDLKDDPQLRQLLCDCGCGHLFELVGEEQALRPAARTIKPFADELKQYVGLAA